MPFGFVPEWRSASSEYPLIALGRKVEAIRDLREVLKSNPQSDEAKQLLASDQSQQPTIKAPWDGNRACGQVLGRVGQSAIAPRINSPAEVNPSNVLPREAPIPSGLPKSQPPLLADVPKPGWTGAVPAQSRASALSILPAPGDQRHEALMPVHQGRQLVNRQFFQRAIEVFDRAISFDPSSALAFNSRGYAYLRIGDFNRAVEDFLDLSPKLRQPVKSQNSANGELTHGVVATEVHKGNETGCGSAAGNRLVGR